jgi:hypothetical protein
MGDGSTLAAFGGPRASSKKTRIETLLPLMAGDEQRLSEGKFQENKD